VKEDRVKKSSFTEKQIAVALRQAEAGTPVAQSCRNVGNAEQRFAQGHPAGNEHLLT
jgi:putative transposase